jgi:hypothetical protein
VKLRKRVQLRWCRARTSSTSRVGSGGMVCEPLSFERPAWWMTRVRREDLCELGRERRGFVEGVVEVMVEVTDDRRPSDWRRLERSFMMGFGGASETRRREKLDADEAFGGWDWSLGGCESVLERLERPMSRE